MCIFPSSIFFLWYPKMCIKISGWKQVINEIEVNKLQCCLIPNHFKVCSLLVVKNLKCATLSIIFSFSQRWTWSLASNVLYQKSVALFCITTRSSLSLPLSFSHFLSCLTSSLCQHQPCWEMTTSSCSYTHFILASSCNLCGSEQRLQWRNTLVTHLLPHCASLLKVDDSIPCCTACGHLLIR